MIRKARPGEYPCIRMQDPESLGVIVTDLGPGKRRRFRLPTEAEVETLPSGPVLTDDELQTIAAQDARRERRNSPGGRAEG